MANSFVLKALKIFGLEEMLKLSQILKVRPMQLKKAAGEELILWDDAPEQSFHVPPSKTPEGKVLPFQKEFKRPSEMGEPVADPHKDPGKPGEEASNFYSSEFMLWQRELTKESGAPLSKKDAVKGYSKNTDMYIVKTPSEEGKEKIRFASTNGVLVNKKQA